MGESSGRRLGAKPAKVEENRGPREREDLGEADGSKARIRSWHCAKPPAHSQA